MANPDDDTVEVRFNVPRAVYDVFDAVRMGRNMNKSKLAIQIFVDWADREAHVSTLVQRITRGKAIASPAEWDSDGH